MLFTSFHLAEKNGADKGECLAWAHMEDQFAFQYTEGVPILTVLDATTLKDALWCLRAVHDEQLVIARKIARVFILALARKAVAVSQDAYLNRVLSVAADYINSLASMEDVRHYRKELWEYGMKGNGHDFYRYHLAWLTFHARPERRASDALDDFQKIVTEFSGQKGWSGFHQELTTTLREALQGRYYGDAGPGTYDPNATLPSSIQKKELRIRSIGLVRKKRQYTFITRKPKGTADAGSSS